MVELLRVVYGMIAVAAVSTTATAAVLEIPLYYGYGGYPRIQTNISWGIPPQAPIPVIFDTGSLAFWTYGPKAIINDGSQYLGQQGPCNKTVKKIYDPAKSSTHSKIVNLKTPYVYSYGGNSKFVSAPRTVNDTIGFSSASSAQIKNVQVALSNFTIVRQLDDGCKSSVDSFDQSILGAGPFGVGGSIASKGIPNFRTNLKRQGQIKSQILSMWMNKAPSSVRGTFTGTALFGQPLPKTAYTYKLISIKQLPPSDSYVGYYSALPTLTIGPDRIGVADSSVTNCLLNSGTGQDQVPYRLANVSQFYPIFEYQSSGGALITAWNGICESIPLNATLNYIFLDAKESTSLIVEVPIRNYARGTFDQFPGLPKTICPLTITFDNYGGCVFGAPFFTAVALQFDDEKKEILLGRGGVA